MPDYKLYKVSDQNIVFATKVSRDIKKLERKYTLINDCILTGMIDIYGGKPNETQISEIRLPARVAGKRGDSLRRDKRLS